MNSSPTSSSSNEFVLVPLLIDDSSSHSSSLWRDTEKLKVESEDDFSIHNNILLNDADDVDDNQCSYVLSQFMVRQNTFVPSHSFSSKSSPNDKRLQQEEAANVFHYVQCKHCDRLFDDEARMKRHVKQRHGPKYKSYICPEC